MLNEISSPSQRLKELFYSTINISTEPTYQAWWIRKFIIGGAAVGFITGGIIYSQDIQADYIRQHNHAVFEGKYKGNRHFWDTLATRCAGRGMKYGFRSAALLTAAATIGISTITYRSKLYLPDWIIGYTALGAISRLWVGPRKMVAGSVICLGIGMFAFGFLRLMEVSTGISISEMEYLSHAQWKLVRSDELNRRHMIQERSMTDYIQEAFKGGDTEGRR